MLSKFLLVGVGGSGGKTLRALRNDLELKLSQAGWEGDLPAAWQFLHIDSPVIQDGPNFPAPMLPPTDYQGLSKAGQAYSDSYMRAMQYVDPADKDDFLRFMPSPDEVSVNPTIGAGQFRGVGRVLLLGANDIVRNALSNKIDKLMGAEATTDLISVARILKVNEQIQAAPTVIVITSLAGGSGAGQFFEVAEMIKSVRPNESWVHEIYNMLYAPDVFTEVDQELLVGNALFAMGEVMNGTWSKSMTEGSKRYAAKMGAKIPDSSKDYRPGAKYNFMVGKGFFETQQDVYKAVSSSLATWMTDQFVNARIIEFTQGNYASSTLENFLPDRSGLKEANKDATPFPALGFGRVGLGKEKFVQYAAQRLARSAIDRMLFAHTKDDPKFAQKTEEDWITFYADKCLFEFIDELKLNEETEEHNDIIDAIRPERGGFFAEFKNQIMATASESLNEKTNAMSLLEWDQGLQDAFNKHISSFLGREALERTEQMRPWVTTKKAEILATTSRYISMQGIKVTAEILRRVSDKLVTVSSELRAEAAVSMKYARDLSTYIRGELGQIPEKNQNSIEASNSVIDASLEHVVDSFSFRAEASLKEEVAVLITDMAHNFIDPLRADISSIYQGLLESKEEFDKWTEEDSHAVPNTFRPSKNEKLLIDTDDYPKEFSKLVNNSVNEARRSNAMQVVINEVIMGAFALPDLDRRNWWQFIDTKRDWVPTTKEAREDSLQVPQSAKFDVSIKPSDYLERAQKWMKRMGTPFAMYRNETLASYLSKGEDKSEIKKRQSKFINKLEEAINDGAPLVNYNLRLLNEVHDNKPSVSTVVSTFPIGKTDDIYPEVEAVLKRTNMLSSVGDSTFDAQSPVQHIDFFSIHQAVEPMVLDSIMKPISDYWDRYNGDSSTREALLLHRHPRHVWETIPAAELPKMDILKGFFVAKALKQFRTDKSLSVEEQSAKGPKLDLWDSESNSWLNFPHPLFSKDIIRPNDFPGAVLYSIALAILQSNGESSLAPLAPYKRLQKLADIDKPDSPVLLWIEKGDLDRAPQPDEARAGSAQGAPTDRQKALVAYIDETLQKYKTRFEKQSLSSDRDGALARDITWDIREQLISALTSLKKDIQNLDLDNGGDGD
jgi:hypothetical protein